jgi:hypothetical protein
VAAAQSIWISLRILISLTNADALQAHSRGFFHCLRGFAPIQAKEHRGYAQREYDYREFTQLAHPFTAPAMIMGWLAEYWP